MRLFYLIKATLVRVDSAYCICQIAILLVRGGRPLLLFYLLTVPHHVSLSVPSTFSTIGRSGALVLFARHSGGSSCHPR